MDVPQFRTMACFLLLLTALASPTAGASTLAAGSYHTCAIGESAKELRCWGWGDSGRLGNGSSPAPDRAAPVLVSTPVTAWRSVAAGETHSCAIAAAGNVYCWGTNSSGQLGDGTVATRPAPVAVVGLGSLRGNLFR